ncbi:MAG: sigma 54-interacting transcriptional regulator [Planctomycetota bacterium]|nr:sigma 54-interacting transcriptional regulator [Planctomycetota bacterium]
MPDRRPPLRPRRISQLYRAGLVSFEDLTCGSGGEMRRILEEARNFAASDAPMLIVGETGTGKNLLAQAIHNAGPRRKCPFCEINCGGISETLQESELFGHRKGAYTGADSDREGVLQTARGGTLFLNEIGDISLSAQKRLLDVVEYRKYRKLGDDKEIETDVRIIAATNVDIEGLRQKGAFRDDFYFRLACLKVELPPLRKRREDVPTLVDRFLEEFSELEKKPAAGVEPDAMGELVEYDWPGNVRQLRFVVWHALLQAKGGKIAREHVLKATGLDEARKDAQNLEPLEEVEKKYILKALTVTNWNKSRTAQILKLSRPALDRKIQAYNLARR